MDFNKTSDRSGLIQDCEDLCNLGATGVSGNTTLLQTFTRYINQWYLKSVAWILEASSTWDWDDSNYTDFPIGTATLVNDQQDYTLPVASSGADASTLLKVLRVEVKDSAGNYYKLEPFDETQIKSTGLADYEETAGMPRMYREVANSIELYPKPSTSMVTASAGLKVYFQRTPDLFATSDTTQQPGIPQPFHRLLSLGASYDFAISKGMQNASALRQEIEQLKGQMQQFFGRRNNDVKVRLMPRRERYN